MSARSIGADYRTGMGAPVYLRHDLSLQHLTGAHPEQPARIAAIEDELARHDWLGFEVVQSPAATRAQVEAVHTPEHVAAIEALSARGGGRVDLDTVASPHSFEAALHAAGGAVALVDRLLDGSAPTGFSGHRPPGHHAEPDRAMGFCLFNSVAVGAQHALDSRGLERVAILDWDVHHGNGTDAIFSSTERVLFFSIHQFPLYPGTGSAEETGRGAGEGFTVNLPVPAGSGDGTFASLVEHVAVPVMRDYAPELILVSAGFDAHAADPLASCRVTERGFAAMTGSVRRLAAALEVPVGVVLEGGYDLSALARSVAVTLSVLGAAEPPAAVELPEHPEAVAATERLAARWPALSA
jgi:acetoin utilization deacetylase AcuC-like enzyme